MYYVNFRERILAFLQLFLMKSLPLFLTMSSALKKQKVLVFKLLFYAYLHHNKTKKKTNTYTFIK